MLFSHSSGRRRRRSSPLVMLFRLGLSLGMFLVLALLTFQAFKYFVNPSAGPDLFFRDPKAAITQILSSEDIIKTLDDFLGFDFSNGQLPRIKNLSGADSEEPNYDSLQPENKTHDGPPILKFALVTDSHNNNQDLTKALSKAKSQGAKFAIGLGDYTDTGTKQELENSKAAFESGGIPYYVTAGNHDLWDARDKGKAATTNFSEVFGSPYQSFSDSSIRFILLFNSDDYLGVEAAQQLWLKNILAEESNSQKTILVFTHEPVYHPTSNHKMGELTPDVAGQAQDLLVQFKVARVGGIFAGHIHALTQYESPEGIKMMTSGALTATNNPSGPRFTMVDVFSDGGYNISDIEITN